MLNPLFLGPMAIAGAKGLKDTVKGVKKMKKAKGIAKKAETRHEENLQRFQMKHSATQSSVDRLGTKELEIIESFEQFSELIEIIQNKPKFKEYQTEKVHLPAYDAAKIKKISTTAATAIAALKGAALGAAGSFALNGAAVVLPMIGGAAFAGGIVSPLIHGALLNKAGKDLLKKANRAWDQMEAAEKEIDRICVFLDELKITSDTYLSALSDVEKVYRKYLQTMSGIIHTDMKTNWNMFTQAEQVVVENTVLLVQLLYKMCQVNLIVSDQSETEFNEVNISDIKESVEMANNFLTEKIKNG